MKMIFQNIDMKQLENNYSIERLHSTNGNLYRISISIIIKYSVTNFATRAFSITAMLN